MYLRKLLIASLLLDLFIFTTPASYAQNGVKESEQLDFAQGLLSRGMYDMAIAQYQKFINDFPKSPSLQEAFLSLGESYFLSQDLNKAMDTFNQFNQLYPHSDKLPVSILRLAQIDIQEQKNDEALKELNSIDIQNQLKGPMLQSFYFYMAQAYLSKGDKVSAVSFFQKAAQVEGASVYSAQALKEVGIIQTQAGQYKDALDAYSKALAVATDDISKSELVYRAAEAQFLAGNYNDAIKGFSGYLDQYPSQDLAQDALANLLLAYFNLGQYDQLLNAYHQNAKQIRDDDVYFNVHIAAVLATIELKKYEEANKLLDKMLAFPQLKPQERAKIFIKKADIFIREKKYKDALGLLDAFSASDVDETDETFFLKAEAYYGLGDFDRAFNFFENVYLNFPNSRFYKAALLGQAHTRKATGRFKESEILFSKYYQIQDQQDLKSNALYDEVMMASQAGDSNGLIASAQEYLKDFPSTDQYSDVLLFLADAYGRNNQPQEAVNLLQGFLATPLGSKRSNTADFLLGKNLQQLGNMPQALAAYKLVDQHQEDGKFYDQAIKNMAIIYTTLGNFDQAKTYFDQLISQAPATDLQVKTYIWVCNEYLKEQKYDDVLRVAAIAEKHFLPKDLTEIKYFEAEALRGKGHCDEAVKDYDAVTGSNQKDMFTGSAHIGHGLCLEEDQKFDEAKEEFKKALDENADDYTITAHATFETANADAAQGNFDEAVKYYLLVATIYDDEFFCSESLLKAAQISERLKHNSDALKMYTEILDKYKNSVAAQYAKTRVGAARP